MTFEFGHQTTFSFSTKDPGFTLGGRKYVAAPTVTFGDTEGGIVIRESFLGLDIRDRPCNPAVFVARSFRLYPGKYIFDPPTQSPGPNDISIVLRRPEGVVWQKPELRNERVAETQPALNLVLTKKLSQWSSVDQIRVIMHNGMNCRLLDMSRLVETCEIAEASLITLGKSLMTKHRHALQVEENAKAKELAAMGRDSIPCEVGRNATNPRKMVLAFNRNHEGKRWGEDGDELLD